MWTAFHLNLFFNSPLSESISYDSGSGSVSIRAIVDLSFKEEQFEDSELGASDPVIFVRDSDVPDLDVLQSVVIRGKSYVIESIAPEGDGTTKLTLEPA